MRDNKDTKIAKWDLASQRINLTIAKSLAAYLTHSCSLTELSLCSNELGDEGSKLIGVVLANNNSLTSLSLHGNNIGPDSGASIAEALKVNGLMAEVSLDGFALPVKALKGTDRVERLDLSHQGLGVASALVIASLIGVNNSLTECNLRGNDLRTEGWCAIFDALRDNRDNKIDKWDLDRESISSTIAKSMTAYVAVSDSLTSLNVCMEGITGNCARQLAATVISKHTLEIFCHISLKKLRANTLSSLDLSNKGISVTGALVLAEFLRTISGSLTSLNISSNGLGSEGSAAIAMALKVNRSLTSLVLYNNNIGAKGASALAEALIVNGSLTVLDLTGNLIGDTGSVAIAEALQVNSSLTSLNLKYNGIGSEGGVAGMAIVETLTLNGSLSSLNFGYNSLGADSKSQLRHAVQGRPCFDLTL